MKNWPKTRIGRAFAAAAIGATAATGAILYNYPEIFNGNDIPIDPPEGMSDRAWTAPEDVWDEIVGGDISKFDFGYHTPKDLPAGERTITVQIESSLLDDYGLLLEPGFNPQGVLHRHGEAAAHIMDEAADRMSGEDVDSYFIEKPSDLDNWVYNINSPYAFSLFYNADFVNLSMGIPAQGHQRFARSSGYIDTPREIENADKFWAGTDAIFFKSAGNSGNRSYGMQRAHAEMYMRADTMAFVGEAGVSEDGIVAMEGHSSRSGASFAVTNPFFQGYRYPYVRDQELPDVMDRVYDNVSELYKNLDISGEDIFADKLKVQFYSPNSIASLKEAHPDFEKAVFDGKEYISEQDTAWQYKNAGKVLNAFKNGITAAREHWLDYFNADEREGIASLYGTSFASPHATGMFAAMHEKYEDLNEYDLLAAALIAAEPVYLVKQYGEGHGKVPYSFNGKLWHNPGAAGFGFLSEDAFAKASGEMANMLANDPMLASQEQKASSSYVQFTPDSTTDVRPEDIKPMVNEPELENSDNIQATFIEEAAREGLENAEFHEYPLEIGDDVLALRTNLAVEFKGGMAVAPEYITLINPLGGEVRVSPTKLLRGDGDYSLATTDGHFGIETKGTWKIRVPDHIEIESARLDISGVTRGGLIEKYLDQHIQTQGSGTTLDYNVLKKAPEFPVPKWEGFGPY